MRKSDGIETVHYEYEIDAYSPAPTNVKVMCNTCLHSVTPFTHLIEYSFN